MTWEETFSLFRDRVASAAERIRGINIREVPYIVRNRVIENPVSQKLIQLNKKPEPQEINTNTQNEYGRTRTGIPNPASHFLGTFDHPIHTINDGGNI